jgi:hypothetical protein
MYWMALIVGFCGFWCGFALAAALSAGKYADDMTGQHGEESPRSGPSSGLPIIRWKSGFVARGRKIVAGERSAGYRSGSPAFAAIPGSTVDCRSSFSAEVDSGLSPSRDAPARSDPVEIYSQEDGKQFWLHS